MNEWIFAETCGQKCSECMRPSQLRLHCGHIKSIHCHQLYSGEGRECVENCTKTLKCGHQCVERYCIVNSHFSPTLSCLSPILLPSDTACQNGLSHIQHFDDIEILFISTYMYNHAFSSKRKLFYISIDWFSEGCLIWALWLMINPLFISRCRDPCTVKCEAMVEQMCSECGESKWLPCHQANSSIRLGISSVQAYSFKCTTPCTQQLKCGHKCPGTCYEWYVIINHLWRGVIYHLEWAMLVLPNYRYHWNPWLAWSFKLGKVVLTLFTQNVYTMVSINE